MTEDGSQDPQTSLLFDVFALGRAVRTALESEMSAGPLTPEEYAFYSAIFEFEQIRPVTLARRLGTPLTTVMDQLARYEARGHVMRRTDPRDQRATLCVLSAAGRRAHAEANALFESVHARFVAALPNGVDQPQQVLASLRRAIDNAAIAAGTRTG